MAQSTGPVLAMGAITLGNAVLLNGQPIQTQLRIPVGVGITAAALALVERVWPAGAVGLAWLALTAVLLVRVDPTQPAPLENLETWYRKVS
jgi:hypothetical protein